VLDRSRTGSGQLDQCDQDVEIAQGHEYAFGVKIELEATQLALALVNTATDTEMLRQSLAPLFKPGHLLPHAAKIMATEDFAWMLTEVAGCYFFLGNGEGEFHSRSVHNPLTTSMTN
jgi:hippurate hydrolase